MKKSIKKIISISLAIILLLSALSISAFALEHEDFDVNDLTLNDLSKMSVPELEQVLADFERVYDPFDTYRTTPLMELNQKPKMQPYWISGKQDISETGSHEIITISSITMLLNDIGYNTSDKESAIVFGILSVAVASVLPDKGLTSAYLSGYAGHFYDPDTNKNYLKIGDTAKDNFIQYYDKSKKEYKKNGYSDDYLKNVGKAIHYIQDACEPHHAANIIKFQYDDAHSVFENYVNEHIDSLLKSTRSFSYQKYIEMNGKSLEELIYEPAKIGKSLINTVLDINNTSQWRSTARTTVFNAVDYTAFVLYKLGVENDIL